MMENRILRNTTFLYMRQILLIVISLYSIRVLLDELGIDDYGIFTVIASFIAFGSFISGGLSSATQRFFSFALGKGDKEELRKTFSTNLVLYLSIGLIVYVLLSSLGKWYLINYIDIPPNRFESAIELFRFASITFVITIITTPFISILIAHEDMDYYAYISIVEAILKLVILYMLSVISGDKLVIYGLLLLVISVFVLFVYIVVCSFRFDECQYKKLYFDLKLMKRIFSFTGWTFFGQLSSVARNQAITIMLNQFFNPTIVAARAISVSISNQATLFAVRFNTSLYPPIIKLYADNKLKEMHSLVNSGALISFFLMWFFALPIMLELEFILDVWLVDYPKEVIVFTTLSIVEVVIFSISLPVATAARAPGNVRNYELILGALQFSIAIVAYLLLKQGYGANSVFIVGIVINVVMLFVRLKLVAALTGMNIKKYIIEVLIPILKVIFVSSILGILIQQILPRNMVYSFITVLSSMLISTLAMYYIAIDENLKKKIFLVVKGKITKSKARK